MMKLLSKFIQCYYGPTLSPVPELENQLPEKISSNSSRKFHSARHWKPALAVISEDRFASEMHRRSRSATTSCERSRSTARNRNRSRSHNADNREICNTMALPAFSPTPFVF